VALIPGYSDFRLLDSDADVGVAIFSYRYPSRLTSVQALETAQSQIQKSDACFHVTERTEQDVQLRCAELPKGFWEYRLRSDRGRIIAMFGDFNSPEKVSHYSDHEEAFLRAATSAY
jgi:hypothetical protein